MLGDVASEVEKATSGKQKPFRNHNLQGARPCCLLAPEPAVAADAKAAIVPAELAAWLKELALEAHGPRLVADHKIAFLRDVRFLDEKELTDSGMGKLEAKRFVAAAAKLGATQRISGVVVEAAAAVTEKAAEAARLAAAKTAEAEAQQQRAREEAARQAEAARIAEAEEARKKAAQTSALHTLSPKAQEFADQMVGKTSMNLSARGIDDAVANALAEALKVNTSLTTLDLHRNSIGDGGASALAEALKVNTSLTTLHLHSNSIGAGGASALKGNARIGCNVYVSDQVRPATSAPSGGCCVIS